MMSKTHHFLLQKCPLLDFSFFCCSTETFCQIQTYSKMIQE